MTDIFNGLVLCSSASGNVPQRDGEQMRRMLRRPCARVNSPPSARRLDAGVSARALLPRVGAPPADLQRLGVSSLAVVGSVARGDGGGESDVDLLVEFSEPVGLFRFVEVKAYLESILGCEVDLVTPDALKPQLREAILAEALHAL